ncbi:GTP-binding protein TypA/BipA-like protein [Smittium mucronatum]|uniref:GTP-binding protein TypA/BipA-like protein n=1 Tax=Smittium mucronatum TaxID=133383 RepID=A0A1R0H8S0_9FUNG|nr:GTP-binding protein TypA/BipA-like protein [Smittium mucronatum]
MSSVVFKSNIGALCARRYPLILSQPSKILLSAKIRSFSRISANQLSNNCSRVNVNSFTRLHSPALPLAQKFYSSSSAPYTIKNIRNVGIIAHVDHGKTTMVDALLKQAGLLSNSANSKDTLVMDSNELEKERGMTILSKVTSFMYKDHRINIVDTPGHADFGGEVERILSMVDGVVLVTDATEGPMAQTKFVLTKALQYNLCPIVVLNKIDRETSRPDEVDSELLELFMALDASDKQMDYPLLYASAKQGWSTDSLESANQLIKNPPSTPHMEPLLNKIIDFVPHPMKGNPDFNPESNQFKMLVTQIEPNSYLGRCYLGRIESGKIKVGDPIKSLTPPIEEAVSTPPVSEVGRVTKIMLRRGLEVEEIEQAIAGDIVLLSGLKTASINYTICSNDVTEPLPFVPIDPPTVSMSFGVNDSPLAGKEGSMLTSTVIRDRLLREAETNIALQIVQSGSSDSFEVRGRGELQLSILIETMRREGFELSVSPPRVLLRKDPDDPHGKKIQEPIEEAVIDVDSDMAGVVIEKLTKRKAEMKKYLDVADKARLIFHIPTRGLLGYQSELKNDTRGTGALTHSFLSYEEYKGPIEKARKGSLVATGSVGACTTYALNLIEPRGKLFIKPGDVVYPGMIVGEYNKDQGDLEVNPTKAKQLTNIRTVHKDERAQLTPVQQWTLEEAISYVNPGEKIEVTPTKIRLRKQELDPTRRKQLSRRSSSDLEYLQ